MYSAYHSATWFFPFTSKSQCSYLPDALYSFGGVAQSIPWYGFGIIYLSGSPMEGHPSLHLFGQSVLFAFNRKE